MTAIRDRISHRSRRAALTTLDQGMFSVSNFAVGVAVARMAGAAGLGSYSLAYALWLAFQALHRGLITDPMAIENQVMQPEAQEHVATGLASELTLGLAASTLFGLLAGTLLLFGQRTFGFSVLALSPWLPALLIQDYWRWIAFMQGKPGRAVANDLVFDGVQGALFAGLILFGMRSPAVAISAWGAGAAAAALFGLRQFSVTVTVAGGIGKLRSHWPISRWLSANGLTSWGTSQSYAPLTAAILGPVGVGALRAAQTLVGGVALVLLQSAGSLGLPESCRSLNERGMDGLRSVTRYITTAAVAAIGALAVVVAADGAQLLRLFYGKEFGRYSEAATILALGLVASAASIGAILTLKATRQTRTLFGIILTQTVVTTVAITTLSPFLGVNGAAVGMSLGCVIATVSLLWAQRRTLRTTHLDPGFSHGIGSRPIGDHGERPVPTKPVGDLVRRLTVLQAEIARARTDERARTAARPPMPVGYGTPVGNRDE